MTAQRPRSHRTISSLSRLGATALLGVALATHVSADGGRVAGRWSLSFAAIISTLLVAGVALAASAWANREPQRSVATRLADAAALIWAAAFLWGTVVAGESPTRLFSLRLFGSTSAPAAGLEWLALVLAALSAMIAVGLRLRGRARDAFVAVSAMVCAGWLAEGVTRAYTLARPTTHGYDTYSNELWYARHRRLNSLGFRDVEPTMARTEGRRRLVLIGDSFAFANGVDRLGDRFGEQLVARLRANAGGEWELLNASRGNTNTIDHIAMLATMLPYQPDLAILLYVFNDADYLKQRVRVAAAVNGLPRDFRRDWTPVALLMRNSYLFQEIYLRLRIVAYRRAQREENIEDAYSDTVLVARHLADLSRFVSTARAGGTDVRIVPYDIAVVADVRLRRRDERFLGTLESAGFPVCPILTAFEGHAFGSLTVNALDLHPNPAANALAADAAWRCIARAFGPKGGASRSGAVR